MGRDRGRGAKYLMVPPNYDGPLLPNALVYKQETYHGWTAMRPIMAGGPTPENLAKATAFTKKIRIHPLSEAKKPPKGKESNWLPTDPKRRFFLLSRFYGPEPALFDGSFELNNIELVK